MYGTRVIAVVLGGLGLMLLQSAVMTTLGAFECTQTQFSPYTCESAHEEPNVNASTNMQCAYGPMNACGPAPGSSCGGDHGVGVAVPGRCKIVGFGSTPYYCTEGYGETIVEVHYWRSNCVDRSGQCVCEVEVDWSRGSKDVQVCECHDSTSN